MPTHSSPARPDIWAGPLPPALALMAPSTCSPRWRWTYLPVVPDARGLQTTPAVVQLTLSVYMLMLGLDLRSAVRPHRPAAAGGALLWRRAWRWPPAAAACSSRGCCRRWAPRPRWWPCSPPCATFMPTGRKAPPSMACSAPCWPSSPRSGRCSARPSRRASAGGRSSSRWARRACWRGCAPCRAGARPSIRAGRGGPASPMLGSLRFWIYTRIQRGDGRLLRVLLDLAARAHGRAGYPYWPSGLSTVALVRSRHALAPRLVARWGIAGSFARGAATMLAGAALLAGCAATTAPSCHLRDADVAGGGGDGAGGFGQRQRAWDYGDASGAAVALYYAAQSLIVAGWARCPRRWMATAPGRWSPIAPPCPRPACWDRPCVTQGSRPARGLNPPRQSVLDQPRCRAIRQQDARPATGALADRHLVRTIGAGAELDGGRACVSRQPWFPAPPPCAGFPGGVAPQRPPHQPGGHAAARATASRPAA